MKSSKVIIFILLTLTAIFSAILGAGAYWLLTKNKEITATTQEEYTYREFNGLQFEVGKNWSIYYTDYDQSFHTDDKTDTLYISKDIIVDDPSYGHLYTDVIVEFNKGNQTTQDDLDHLSEICLEDVSVFTETPFKIYHCEKYYMIIESAAQYFSFYNEAEDMTVTIRFTQSTLNQEEIERFIHSISS